MLLSLDVLADGNCTIDEWSIAGSKVHTRQLGATTKSCVVTGFFSCETHERLLSATLNAVEVNCLATSDFGFSD